MTATMIKKFMNVLERASNEKISDIKVGTTLEKEVPPDGEPGSGRGGCEHPSLVRVLFLGSFAFFREICEQ